MRELIEKLEAVSDLAEAGASGCRDKYIDAKTGRFKGGKGERFKNCVAYMQCKGGVEDPEAVCASIARKKGAASGQAEDVEILPEDVDELLMEAERAQKALIVRTADAMVNAPAAVRYMNKLPLAGYEMQLQQAIEALLTQILQSKGVGVSGGSQALRMIRGIGRGTMPMV